MLVRAARPSGTGAKAGAARPLDPRPPGSPTSTGSPRRRRAAGVRVDVRWRGETSRPLPPDIDLSAFRIIQEAVTNVVRHAGTAPAG